MNNILKRIQKFCKKKEDVCLRGYEIRKLLGKGSYGKVFHTCKPKDNCIYAMKVVELNEEEDINDFRKEVSIASKMSRLEITPKVYGAWFCKNKGYIVTEKYDVTLKTHLEYHDLSKNLINRLENILEKMHNAGIVHGDLSLDNVMIKFVKGKKKIGIIDWGLAFETNEKHPVSFKRMKQYLQDIYGKCFSLSKKDIEKDPTLWDQPILCYLNKIYKC